MKYKKNTYFEHPSVLFIKKFLLRINESMKKLNYCLMQNILKCY